MERVAFQLKIRAGKIEEYEAAHRQVWPELLAEFEACGITHYSIFRRGQQLFLTMHVPNFAEAIRHLQANHTNRNWQQTMEPLFEPMAGLLEDETFAMMKEVFYFEGKTSSGSGTFHTKSAGAAVGNGRADTP